MTKNTALSLSVLFTFVLSMSKNFHNEESERRSVVFMRADTDG